MNRTKTAIIDAFWQLLEEKSYSKITVKDIVDRCQINRNTFYYHFHDIPELLESTLIQDADLIIQSCARLDSPMDCLTPLMELCLSRKKALLHIYRSTQKEAFIHQFDRICLYTTTQYINKVTDGLQLVPEDKNLLIRFYKCTLVGLLLDWMDTGMNYDLLKGLGRVTELLGNSIMQALLKAADSVPAEQKFPGML